MAATGPGLDGPGEIFFGSGTADRVIIGAGHAVMIDNITEPPTISVAGASFGEFSSLFGNGIDGSVVVAVDTRLDRDMYYENLTINPDQVLDPGGYRIFVKGTLTLNGVIRSVSASGTNGEEYNADDPAIGGVASIAGTLGGGQAGANGGISRTKGSDGILFRNSLGGRGGLGGDGAGVGGLEGETEIGVAAGGIKISNSAVSMILGRGVDGTLLQGGAGGAGGGGGNSSTRPDGARGGGGGAGGAGGRNIMVSAARVIVGQNSMIESKGGAGGDGGLTNETAFDPMGGGGGGGGGGGLVVLIYKNISALVKMDSFLRSTGGAGGKGGISLNYDPPFGAGLPGGNGSAGVCVAIRV